MSEQPGKIYEAIAALLEDTKAIGKDKVNQQQNYKFRGIDDVYNAVHPLLAKHKVFSVSRVIGDVTREERQTSRGGLLIYTSLKMKYRFYTVDGSSVTTETVGEGMDSGDKSTNKAMSAAYKYALFQLLSIPTEAVDSEQDSPDPAPRTNGKPNGQPKQNGKPAAKGSEPAKTNKPGKYSEGQVAKQKAKIQEISDAKKAGEAFAKIEEVRNQYEPKHHAELVLAAILKRLELASSLGEVDAASDDLEPVTKTLSQSERVQGLDAIKAARERLKEEAPV